MLKLHALPSEDLGRLTKNAILSMHVFKLAILGSKLQASTVQLGTHRLKIFLHFLHLGPQLQSIAKTPVTK
jgi:uncharacterized protein YhhL (DUF1145 family)